MNKFSAILALLMFLGLSLFNFEGALLCFGNDGHVAVEFVGACNGPEFSSQVAQEEGDGCGPCKDVQFQRSPACINRTFHYTDAQTFPLVSSALITQALPLRDHPSSLTILPEKPPYKTLAGLQSVVLLI